MLRRLSIMLGGVVILALLAACGGTPAASTPTATSSNAVAPTATSTSAAPTPILSSSSASSPTPDSNQGPPYFQGKTIRIVTPGSPGGGYDAVSRIIATRLGHYIPGNPTVIVQNMPGGNTDLAPNYVYNDAPKDGTYIAQFVPQTSLLAQLEGQSYVKYDASKWNYLGSPTASANTVNYCRVDVVGTGSPQQIAQQQKAGKIKSPLIDGRQTNQDPSMAILGLETGLQFKVVSGYAASAEVNRALENGESDCAGSTLDSALVELHAMYTANQLNFVGQTGLANGSRDPRIPNAPTWQELATTPAEKVLVTAQEASDIPGRPFVVAPGVPANVVKILQTAMWQAINDPEVVQKLNTAKLTTPGVSVQDTENAVNKLFAMSATDRKTVVDFFENGVVPSQ